MSKSTELNSGRHCVFKMHVHLVFVTKYRKGVFTTDHLNYMEEIFTNICKPLEAELVEFNGEENHVHLLVEYQPKLQLSVLVNTLKGVSSRLLRKKFKSLNSYYFKDHLWSPSYFASSCGGAPIDILRKYIENQRLISPS